MLKFIRICFCLILLVLINEYVQSASIPLKKCNEVDQPLAKDCADIKDKNLKKIEIGMDKIRSSRQACLDAYPLSLVIVNGLTTRPKEFPYMVAVGWNTSQHDSYGFHCGGVLISSEFVLSAAHCSTFGGVSPTVVLPGGLNLTDPMAIKYNIAEFIKHPEYHDNSVYNDIALIRLSVPIEFDTSYVKPVCLWQKPKVPENWNLTAIGYGAVQFAGQSSEHLLKTHLWPVVHDKCQMFYKNNSDVQQGIMKTQICLQDQRNLSDTCQGDSGGPVILEQFEDDDQWMRPHVVGITSFGHGCAFNSPGVYTRVSEYVPWIESIVWA